MKNLLLIFALIFATNTAFSQTKISPGLKAGLNFSDLNNFDNSSTKTGLQAGLFVNFHFTYFYELQIETGFSSQGTSIKSTFIDNGLDPLISSRSFDYNLDYATLGIANKFFPFKEVGVNFIVGPSLDILVSKNEYNVVTPFDLSFFGGIGYEFPFGLGLELRYKQGLIDIRKEYAEEYGSGSNYYERNVVNSVIQLGATYRLNF